MPTRVDLPSEFLKQVKVLSRRYPSVTKELNRLLDQLEADERPGDKVPGVGYNVYKARMRNPSAGKGKSGGFRVIYYVRFADYVVLILIYSKSDQSDISPLKIRKILEEISPPDSEDDDAE